MRTFHAIAMCGVLTATSAAAAAQTDKPGAAPAAASQAPASERYPITRVVYPRDAERPVCKVDGHTYTFGDMFEHVAEHHAPRMEEFMRTPAGNLYFQSELPALWVRYFADVIALRAEARGRDLTVGQINEAASEALKREFLRHIESFQREKWSESLYNTTLEKFQRQNGLRVEARGLLDLLVPEECAESELYEYYQGHAREFGGYVTLAHILIYHRHPVTLQLLDKPARDKARARAADLAKRLAEDGSNFEDLAARYSEDRRTAPDGGVLHNVGRFDTRLPPILPRTAWSLRDGEWSGPVESQFGLHFVKRISFSLRSTILYTDGAKPTIRKFRRKKLQEDLLYATRKKHAVQLLY